jgi:uncharacterized protein (UPF0128 family)
MPPLLKKYIWVSVYTLIEKDSQKVLTRFWIKDKLAALSEDAATIGLLNVNSASRMDKSTSLSIISFPGRWYWPVMIWA